MNWKETIDPSTIPENVLRSEIARRNSARRKTFGTGGGRPPTMRECPRCHQQMTATELRRKHTCTVETEEKTK